MRDDRGRYHSTKPLSELAPSWANGCDQCKFGVLSAPELTGVASVYLERLVQAIDGDLQFCTCRAGECYKNALRNRLLVLRGEAKRDTRMSDAAGRNSHPDIEVTRRAMRDSRAVGVPPIRWDGDAAPATESVEVVA